MKNVTIEASEVYCIEDIHKLLAEELEFPDYYGMNLDALHDCLGDISEETSITVMGAELLYEQLGTGYEKLMRVLNDSAVENDFLYIVEV